MSVERTIICKANYWSFEETEDHELFIHMGGLTTDEKSVHVRIDNFTPFVYVELPKRIKWNKTKCRTLFEFYQERYKSEGPITFSMLKKYKLHYKVLTNVLFLTFPTHKTARTFSYRCARNSVTIYSIGSFRPGDFQVHEQTIDPILKFTAARHIKLASWVTIKETILEHDLNLTVEERKYTTADIDLYCDWRNISPLSSPENTIVQPKYCSFDIECYSQNHNSKLPDPEQKENKVFQISLIFGRFRQPQTDWRKILLTLFDPQDIEEAEVRRFKSERELLLDFTNLIQSENPDVFVGYNIMKFDWNYMITRAEMLGFYPRFAQLSRVVGERAERKKVSWGSNAYGEQEFKFFDCRGRTNVDVLLEIERNYKLPKYSLDTVSEYFLKENKVDITPKQLFMLYQLNEELLETIINREITTGQLKALKKRVEHLLPPRKCTGVVRQLRKRLLKASSDAFCDIVREGIKIIGVYCIQDTVLPIRLAEKLNLWTTMEEMSNCMHVPISYLHTRGQQIKVVAQVFRETMFNDIIIPSNKKSDVIRYQGATVIEANAGDYKNVATLDFASLYPTVMIAYNICYTTILEDSDPTPDEECHVLTWSDHRGCLHDKKKRGTKIKKEDILCGDHRYRFRRAKVSPDGTLEGVGLMPKLERQMLTERKTVKEEMLKMQARLKMQRGQATKDEIEYYKQEGWDIIDKGSLGLNEETVLDVCASVLDAQQKALKVSANSMYGSFGTKEGLLSFIPGAASVTAMGRQLIIAAIDFAVNRHMEKSKFKTLEIKPKLVYGDTDSCMLIFENATLGQTFTLAEEAGKMATHVLKSKIIGIGEDTTLGPNNIPIARVKLEDIDTFSDGDKILFHTYKSIPIDLEFENVYGRYLLLTMKRYIAYVVNKRGETIGVTKKGVVSARRDNCKYLRDSYKMVFTGVLDNKTEAEVMYIIYDRVNALFTRMIPDTDLIIYVGVKNVINYAKKKEIKKGKQVVERVFLDSRGNPINDPIGPQDPRLIFPNLPQALLALKMIMRGDEVPLNTRLEFLYLDPGYAVQHQGEKAEDYTYYKENKKSEGLRPDLLHYVEKQLLKPITELINVKYPHELIPFETADVQVKRCIDAFMRRNDLYRSRISKVGKTVKTGTDTCICFDETDCTCKPRYILKGLNARVDFILSSVGTKANQIHPDRNYELIYACRKWKARFVLDNIYHKYSIRIRPPKKPTKSGDKLPVGTRIMHWPTKTMGVVTQLHEKITQVEVKGGRVGKAMNAIKTKEKIIITFTITLTSGELINSVQRDEIAPLYMRDGTIMKDIFKYRQFYKAVIEQLKNMYSPIKFIT